MSWAGLPMLYYSRALHGPSEAIASLYISSARPSSLAIPLLTWPSAASEQDISEARTAAASSNKQMIQIHEFQLTKKSMDNPEQDPRLDSNRDCMIDSSHRHLGLWDLDCRTSFLSETAVLASHQMWPLGHAMTMSRPRNSLVSFAYQ